MAGVTHRVAEHAEAVLVTGLRGLDQPGRVLERHRLRHDEMVVHAQRRRLRVMQVLARRVEAQRHDLRALQREHAEGFRPAPVVADQHPGDRVHVPPHSESEVADLKIFFLEVLERRLRLVIGVAGQVHLAVLADDPAIGRHQDRGVIAVVVRRQLGVADVEADAELLGLVEQRLGFFRGDALFKEPRVDLGLVLHPPARKEGGEREFGKHHEPGAHRMAFAQQLHQPLGGIGAAVGTVERPELGGGDLEMSAHAPILGAPCRLLR